MKIECWLCRRRSLGSVDGRGNETLGATSHLTRCASCRKYHDELRAIDMSLRVFAPAPRPLADVEASIWREIDRRQAIQAARTRDRQPVRIIWRAVVAGGCAAICIWGGLMVAQRSSSWSAKKHGVTITTASAHSSSAASSSGTLSSGSVSSRRDLLLTFHSNSQSAKSRSLRDDDSRSSKSRRRHRFRTTDRIRLARANTSGAHRSDSPHNPRLAQAPDKKNKPEQIARVPAQFVWASWGAWYEQQGDYDRAAAAYRNAESLASKAAGSAPQPASAYQYTYQAARAAECAGDVTAAIDYYAKMLSGNPNSKEDHAPADSSGDHGSGSSEKPEKGALICRPLNISA